jgi:hypothetical protein
LGLREGAMASRKGMRESKGSKDGFWGLVSELWMGIVLVVFLAIRVLGSETTRSLLSRWKAH